MLVLDIVFLQYYSSKSLFSAASLLENRRRHNKDYTTSSSYCLVVRLYFLALVFP